MKVAIIGSRNIVDLDIKIYLPQNVSMLVSGGAHGVDTLVEKYAMEHKISIAIFKPNYEQYGKSAPLKRNNQIVDFADIVIAIWDGKSRGTKYTINYAQKTGKPVTIHMIL